MRVALHDTTTIDCRQGVLETAADGVYAAVTQGSHILLTKVTGGRPLQLSSSSQRRHVTAVYLTHRVPFGRGESPSRLLLSGSEDAVMAWRVEPTFEATCRQRPAPPPKLLARQPGSVLAMAATGGRAGGGALLAVGLGSTVGVWDLDTADMAFTLEGHSGCITALCFSQSVAGHLVSAAEDRTFKVWDVLAGAVLYQSAEMCSATPTCLAMAPCSSRLAVAFSSGSIAMYDLALLPASATCLQTIDVPADVAALAAAEPGDAACSGGQRPAPLRVSSTPAWQQQLQATAGAMQELALAGSQTAAADSDAVVLSMAFCGCSTGAAADAGSGEPASASSRGASSGDDSSTGDRHEALVSRQQEEQQVCRVLGRPLGLLVGTSQGLLLVDARTYAPGFFAATDATSACSFGPPSGSGRISCCTAREGRPGAHVLQLEVMPQPEPGPATAHGSGGGDCTPGPRTVYQRGALPDASPLKASLAAQAAGGVASTSAGKSTAGNSKGTSASSRGSGSRQGNPGDKKPVTFNRTIKSSGYGFVHPTAKLGRAKPAPVKVGLAPSRPRLPACSTQRQYPTTCPPPVHYQLAHALPQHAPLHAGPVLRLSFSGDGKQLLSCSADRSSHIQLLPASRHQGAGRSLLGHDAPVTSAAWSHEGTFVVTSSADGSAKLWQCNQAAALLSFTHTHPPAASTSGSARGGSSSGGSGRAGSGGAAVAAAYPGEVRSAQFAYLDQVLLLASGSKLQAYTYTLVDQEQQDDIARLQGRSSYRPVGACASAAQSITAASTQNSFLSTLAICCGSNRSIELFDIATMQAICTIPDAHSRACHSVVQPPASPYAPHAPGAYELFATAAADNMVRLWDVRAGRCVRCFSGHKNSQAAVGVAFSPCMRFIAAGSEDQSWCLFDLKSGLTVARTRASDAVLSVAFHPLHPQLAAGCADGSVHFFASGSGTAGQL